ncbi:MAG: hypothetical protein H0U73_01105 [Tatlockia sp.]|nr:hypothetical protein [Tatlockia sp.]
MNLITCAVCNIYFSSKYAKVAQLNFMEMKIMSYRNEKEPFLRSLVHQLTNLVGFLLEVIKQKNEQLEPKYKLVDWTQKKGIGYCKIHLVGTSAVYDYTPETIAADDDFISGFCHVDVRTITNLANLEKYKPKAVVSSIHHEEKIVEIKAMGEEVLTLVPIDGNLNKIIEKFSQNDAFHLGRVVGEQDVQP